MKRKAKLIALIISAVFLLGSAFAICSCAPTNNGPEKPEVVAKVNSVQLKYNNAEVNGTLSVDLTAGTVQLSATVAADEGADKTVTYTSSEQSVATVNNSGLITLAKAGETVITATAGGESDFFVLVVGQSLAGVDTYTITVNGGTASATSAEEGADITLTPTIPEHKTFVRWEYSVDDVWTNGNVFRMPGEEIEIRAVYQNALYTLNVVGATVTNSGASGEYSGNVKDGNLPEYDMTTYKYAYDTNIYLEAISAPAGKIFVGWDYGQKNNRKGELGTPTLDFRMPGETTTVWAVFSDFKSNVWTATGISGYSTSTTSLEGVSGYKVSIPATSAAYDYPENIMGSTFDTTSGGSQLLKAVFRNYSSTQSITVEAYATYYSNIVTTGNVTVPAGQTVVKYFTCGLGINDPWWGFAVRGATSSSVTLDVCLGTAPLYPEGDKALSVSGVAEYVKLDSYTRGGAWNISTSSGRPLLLDNKLGLTSLAIYGGNFDNTVNGYLNAKINNLPAYDASKATQTVYVKVVNNVNFIDNYKGTYKFALSTGTDPIATSIAEKEITVTQAGEVVVLKLEVPNTYLQGNLYFNIIKSKIDSNDALYGHNLSVQLTYNDVMGYQEA